MSFFAQFAHDGKTVDGSENNTIVNTSSIILGGTRAPCIVEEMKWNEHEGAKTVQIKWKLMDGDFKGRIFFQKIDIYANKFGTTEPDLKKRFRAANVLQRLFMLLGAQPPQQEPTDADFAVMVGQIAGLAIEVYGMNGRKGNWVSEIQPAKGFECVTGTEEAPESSAPDGAAGGQQQATGGSGAASTTTTAAAGGW